MFCALRLVGLSCGRGGALMAATSHSSSLVPVQPVFTGADRRALAGFLAGYRGLTREAYILDLRQSPQT
jgi:hypothetical protein